MDVRLWSPERLGERRVPSARSFCEIGAIGEISVMFFRRSPSVRVYGERPT